MKYILVGKCGNNDGGGPSNIIKGMLKEYLNQGIMVESILWNNDKSKFKFIGSLVKRILLRKNVVVNVHTSGFLIPLLILIFSKININNYYYLTVHGIYAIESKEKGTSKALYILLERLIYVKFPNIICVSNMLKMDIKNIFNRSSKVYVIPNATNAKSNLRHKINNFGIKLIMLGGLRKRKGIDESIKLIEYLVNKKGLNVFLDIYGFEEGMRNTQWLGNVLKKLNIEKNIIYKGNISNKQILYDEISQADFQICLSHYDTFNVAVAESLVLGCPCIVTNKCGAAYLIEQNYNGLIVKLDDVNMKQQIYEYICSFINNSEKRQEIYISREKYIKLLSWENVCKSYIELMQEN